MKKHRLGLLCGVVVFIGFAVSAGDVRSYQVSGPVLDVTATTITGKKGNDKWEIARNSETKVTGDLKTGAKVTIYYTMVASEVAVKSSKKDTKTKVTKKINK